MTEDMQSLLLKTITILALLGITWALVQLLQIRHMRIALDDTQVEVMQLQWEVKTLRTRVALLEEEV